MILFDSSFASLGCVCYGPSSSSSYVGLFPEDNFKFLLFCSPLFFLLSLSFPLFSVPVTILQIVFPAALVGPTRLADGVCSFRCLAPSQGLTSQWSKNSVEWSFSFLLVPYHVCKLPHRYDSLEDGSPPPYGTQPPTSVGSLPLQHSL